MAEAAGEAIERPPLTFNLLSKKRMKNKDYRNGALTGYYKREVHSDDLLSPEFRDGYRDGDQLWNFAINIRGEALRQILLHSKLPKPEATLVSLEKGAAAFAARAARFTYFFASA